MTGRNHRPRAAPGGGRALLPLVCLLAFGLALYAPTLGTWFVSEDLICVWTWGFGEALEELTSPGVDVGYRPVAVLFWALNRLLWGEDRQNRQPLIFRLRRGPGEAADLAAVTLLPETLEDNRWHSFRFPAVEVREGESLYFELESPASEPGDAVTLWASTADSHPGGQLFDGAEPAEGDLRFRVFYRERAP